MQVQKCNAKQIESKIRSTVTAKTQMPKMLLDTRLVHIWGACRCAVSVAWLSCIPVLEFGSHAICARMSFNSVWVSVPASTLEWAHKFSGKVEGWRLAQPPQPKSQMLLFGKAGAHFPGDDPTEGPFVLFFFAFVLFCFFFVTFFCFLLCLFVGFHYFIFQFFTISFKSIQLWRSPIRIGTFPFGWPPVHLAGMSLNIARSSSASRVHRGPPFSSLMFPLSSAQVLLPCPSAFTVSICAAFCIFLWPWLHFIWLYSPRIMSNLPTCIGSFHVFFICQVYPFPSCICSFYFSSISNFCLFSTCILLFHCSAIVMCAPFRFAFSNSIVLHCFSIFSKM